MCSRYEHKRDEAKIKLRDQIRVFGVVPRANIRPTDRVSSFSFFSLLPTTADRKSPAQIVGLDAAPPVKAAKCSRFRFPDFVWPYALSLKRNTFFRKPLDPNGAGGI